MTRIEVFLVITLYVSFVSCSNKKRNLEERIVQLKTVGGVNIPVALEPTEIIDELLPNGDGRLLHRYLINEALYEDISNQLTMEGRPLPFAENVYIDNIVYEYLDENDRGVYKLVNDQEDPRDIHLIILNETRMELIILISRS